ncbi:hypothetical protein E2C01_054738 [Portunus trituberculatus]|uniref:Uncharacterized protein n=1 Tax=Portunus trituberculatus TaxID=210409 RepID=A0A5B7GSV3_PORTR|nr:hypothetical protein [Portunus trituberculatus]
MREMNSVWVACLTWGRACGPWDDEGLSEGSGAAQSQNGVNILKKTEPELKNECFVSGSRGIGAACLKAARLSVGRTCTAEAREARGCRDSGEQVCLVAAAAAALTK